MTEASPMPGMEPHQLQPLESEIAFDLVKRGLPFFPVWIGICTLIWGTAGASSSAYGLAIVAVNFLFSGILLAGAARISVEMMMGAALFGYFLRLGLVLVAVLVVAGQSWIDVVPLGITLIVSHLGLLVWELRHIGGSLAYPSLKPPTNGRVSS